LNCRLKSTIQNDSLGTKLRKFLPMPGLKQFKQQSGQRV